MSIEYPNPASDNEKSEGTREKWDISRALAEIQLIKQEVMASGAFDEEPEALDHVVVDVRNGVITPVDGVLKARQINRMRQQYH